MILDLLHQLYFKDFFKTRVAVSRTLFCSGNQWNPSSFYLFFLLLPLSVLGDIKSETLTNAIILAEDPQRIMK